ncbi:MAG: nucleotide pyrophosphohydrolase [Acidiferrobacterales bacterium]
MGNRAPLEDLKETLRAFVRARDWVQFHSPKNLSMALMVEAAELLEHFQWLSEQQSSCLSPQERERVALEIADVFIYLLRLADTLDVDLIDAAQRKIELNEKRYPAEQVRGRAVKTPQDSQ